MNSNVRMKLSDHYEFSISQEADHPSLVEVALLEALDGLADYKVFVPTIDWAHEWVGAGREDVIRYIDGHDVKDLLDMAKEFVYKQKRG
jgi:hypothetical protein